MRLLFATLLFMQSGSIDAQPPAHDVVEEEVSHFLTSMCEGRDLEKPSAAPRLFNIRSDGPIFIDNTEAGRDSAMISEYFDSSLFLSGVGLPILLHSVGIVGSSRAFDDVGWVSETIAGFSAASVFFARIDKYAEEPYIALNFRCRDDESSHDGNAFVAALHFAPILQDYENREEVSIVQACSAILNHAESSAQSLGCRFFIASAASQNRINVYIPFGEPVLVNSVESVVISAIDGYNGSIHALLDGAYAPSETIEFNVGTSDWFTGTARTTEEVVRAINSDANDNDVLLGTIALGLGAILLMSNNPDEGGDENDSTVQCPALDRLVHCNGNIGGGVRDLSCGPWPLESGDYGCFFGDVYDPRRRACYANASIAAQYMC